LSSGGITSEVFNVTVDKHFGSSASGIIVAAHRKPIGSRGEYRKQVAALDGRQASVFCEKVSAFTDWANYVHDFGAGHLQSFASVRRNETFVHLHRPDKVKGIIQSGANKVVHTCVDDDELFGASCLCIEHPAQQNRGIGADTFTRLENLGRQAVLFRL